jgi:hypothetical protein
MDGPDFLVAAALPAKFDRVGFVRGGDRSLEDQTAVNTGDIIWSE